MENYYVTRFGRYRGPFVTSLTFITNTATYGHLVYSTHRQQHPAVIQGGWLDFLEKGNLLEPIEVLTVPDPDTIV